MRTVSGRTHALTSNSMALLWNALSRGFTDRGLRRSSPMNLVHIRRRAGREMDMDRQDEQDRSGVGMQRLCSSVLFLGCIEHERSETCVEGTGVSLDLLAATVWRTWVRWNKPEPGRAVVTSSVEVDPWVRCRWIPSAKEQHLGLAGIPQA
jgi:hypothetical protein